DYGWGRPSPSVLRAKGISFVCRYVSWDDTGKNLTRAEAQTLTSAGIDIVLNWSYDMGEALSGYGKGVENATEAQRQALAAGMPPDRPIYFSIDFDAQAGDQAAIDS